MNTDRTPQTKNISQSNQLPKNEVMQRKCACGNHITASAKCDFCDKGQPATTAATAQRQEDDVAAENRTGMPSRLKAGLETLSGIDLSSVRVHRNSEKPSQVDALAYTQGQNIYVGPGQEKYLPHEGWHTVQQMQGRVQPTIQAKGVSINDEVGLEQEADMMGMKALQISHGPIPLRSTDPQSNSAVQLQNGEDDDRAFVQPEISYAMDDEQSLVVDRTNTFWGSVPNSMDDSYFKTLGPPFFNEPRMTRGIGSAGVNMSFQDWRDTVYLNDQFLPPAAMEYNPDGGGGMAVSVQYSYGGYQVGRGGKKAGFHNLLFSLTYDSNMTTSSSAGVEIGAEYNGVGGQVSASSSVSVGQSALSFSREIAFHSWDR